MQPVYAFDQLFLPAGAEVNGHIARIGSPGGKQLTLSILNADFTPSRPVEVVFDDIVLADGRRLPLHATVVFGSGQVIRLVDSVSAKGAPAKSGLSAKIDEARQEWHQAMSKVKQPGKMHRAVRLGIAQLPVHPQYIDAGTLYYAELQEPLTFGDESRKRRGVAGDRYTAAAREPGARFTGDTARLRHYEAWRAGEGRGLQAPVRWRPPDSAARNATQWIGATGAAGSPSEAQRRAPYLLS
jgi:hypothetical protein